MRFFFTDMGHNPLPNPQPRWPGVAGLMRNRAQTDEVRKCININMMDENSSHWVYSEYTITGRTGSMQLNVFHVIIKNTPKHVWSAELCIQEMLTLHAILLPKIILPKKSQKNKLKPKEDPSILLTTWSPEYPHPSQKYTQPIKIPYQLGSPCLVPSNQDSKNTQLYMLVV